MPIFQAKNIIRQFFFSFVFHRDMSNVSKQTFKHIKCNSAISYLVICYLYWISLMYVFHISQRKKIRNRFEIVFWRNRNVGHENGFSVQFSLYESIKKKTTSFCRKNKQ